MLYSRYSSGIKTSKIVFGFSLSSGSACKSGSPEPSHVLLAMGLSEDEAHCTIRLSLGYSTTEEEINYVLRQLKLTMNEMKQNIRFVACR